MDSRKDSQAVNTWWINQLLVIDLNKKTLEDYLQVLKNRSLLAKFPRETVDEAFVRLFLAPVSKQEGKYNPPDELLYRLKFLTLINYSPYSQLLFNKMVNCRIFYMLNQQNGSPKTSVHTKEYKQKFPEYSRHLLNLLDAEIARHAKDFNQLNHIKQFSDEIKHRLKTFIKHQKNYSECVYLILLFGEFLKNRYPNKELKFILDEISPYLNDVILTEDVDTTSLYLANILRASVYFKPTKVGSKVVQDLQIGIEAFTLLFGHKPNKKNITEENLLVAKDYFLKDLVPNTPSRVEFNVFFEELANYRLELVEYTELSQIADTLLVEFKNKMDVFFMTTIKYPVVIKAFCWDCHKTANDLSKLNISNDSRVFLQTLSRKIKLAVLRVLWINEFLELELNKAALDNFMLKLQDLSAIAKVNGDVLHETLFIRLYVRDLHKYDYLFRPSDELLYRLKYLTHIHPSPLAFSLLWASIHARALSMINNDLEVKVPYEDFRLPEHKNLSQKYIESSAQVCEFLDTKIYGTKTDAAHLSETETLLHELKLRVDNFDQIDNNFDYFHAAILFGEFLREKFKNKSSTEITKELDIYAFNFRAFKPKDLMPFRIGSKFSHNTYYDLDIDQIARADFINGLHGIATLLSFDLDNLTNDDVNINTINFAKGMTFIVNDIIPNAKPRKNILATLQNIENYGNKILTSKGDDNLQQKGRLLKKFSRGLKSMFVEYFQQAVKNSEIVLKYKTSIHEYINSSQYYLITEDKSEAWASLNKALYQAITDMIVVGTAEDIKAYHSVEPDRFKLFSSNALTSSASSPALTNGNHSPEYANGLTPN